MQVVPNQQITSQDLDSNLFISPSDSVIPFDALLTSPAVPVRYASSDSENDDGGDINTQEANANGAAGAQGTNDVEKDDNDNGENDD